MVRESVGRGGRSCVVGRGVYFQDLEGLEALGALDWRGGGLDGVEVVGFEFNGESKGFVFDGESMGLEFNDSFNFAFDDSFNFDFDDSFNFAFDDSLNFDFDDSMGFGLNGWLSLPCFDFFCFALSD